MQHQIVVEMRTLPMFELAERACRNVPCLETMSGMEVWKILKHTVPVNIRGKRRKRWVLRGPTAESPCLLTVFYETRASLRTFLRISSATMFCPSCAAGSMSPLLFIAVDERLDIENERKRGEIAAT